ncbi:glycosyl hydrolase, partial [Bacteroidota bacterium]
IQLIRTKLTGIFSIMFMFCFLISSVDVQAQRRKNEKTEKDPVSSGTFNSLRFRSIGPAFTSGRINDIAVNPENHSEYYLGVASGGVWKTVNSGTTWKSIFNNYGSYSIGSVVIDPNDSETIWVGTGEYNSQRAIGYGDGIYKSTDGGNSFKNMGLKKSEHIGRIRIDPRNSDVVYVAVQGPLWGPGGDRGLYKTTDGGKNWEKILDISENTGITDILLDSNNPDVLYAASYQRRRHVWTLINGGPESAIYKSIDAGKTFQKLRNGLPSGDIGRIGMAISPINPDYVFAIVEASGNSGGFFRTTNAGKSWSKMSSHVSNSPQYYNRIYCDKFDIDKIWSMETMNVLTYDGGKTFVPFGNAGKHVDNHCMWQDPNDSKHFLIGSDGGLYETFDDAKTWLYKRNLPVTQFYRVALDNEFPFYNIYGGTQDNNSFGGPSNVFRRGGALNDDWFVTCGGDGFFQAVDPTDPNIVYSESQHGGIVRYDKKSGLSTGIKPEPPSGEVYKWNWNAPFLLSPHKSSRIYFGANKLLKSEDYGNSWKEVSPDLTRQIDRNTLPVMGIIQNIDAVSKNKSTSLYGAIVSLTESELKEGLIYVGTDDGLIQITENGGQQWSKIENIEGVPDMTYVSCLLSSQHETNTVYASFDNRKRSDFLPYIFKSTDAGKTWVNIAANLPENGTVHSIAEDHIDPDLLFVGTEFGIFMSLNGGKKWIQMKAGMPTIPVRDIKIHERENDLVLATFGRGFYILDNYSPIRNFNPDILEKEGFIFPIKEGLMYSQTRGQGGQGSMVYSAPNKPYGVTFTYFVKNRTSTKKQKRISAQNKARKDGTEPPYPTWEELRAEEEEERAFLFFSVYDKNNKLVKTIKTGEKTGINRITWNYSTDGESNVSLSGNKANNMASARGGVTAIPGNYKVKLSRNVGGKITELAGPVDFSFSLWNNFTFPTKDYTKIYEYVEKATKLGNAVQATSLLHSELTKKTQIIKQALYANNGSPAILMNEAKRIETILKDIGITFNGNPIISSHYESQPPSLNSRARGLGRANIFLDLPKSVEEQYDIVVKEYTPILEKVLKLKSEIKQLEEKLTNAGLPWMPGQDIPEWK